MLCNKCNLFVHIKCNNITALDYSNLEREPDDVPWFCKLCNKEIVPFRSLANEVLLGLYEFDLPSLADATPSFQLFVYIFSAVSLETIPAKSTGPQMTRS